MALSLAIGGVVSPPDVRAQPAESSEVSAAPTELVADDRAEEPSARAAGDQAGERAQERAGERAEEPPIEAADPERSEDVVHGLEQIVPGLQGNPGQAPRLRWHESWPRYEFDELALTFGFGLVALVRELLPTADDANWVGGGFFDDGPREALVLKSASDRRDAATASEVITSTLVAWPLLVDAFLLSGLIDGAWDVAWQLALISLEALLINHATTLMVSILARRERPAATACREDPTYADPICADPPASESFWSGHTAGAFASASLICLHHDVLDLFGEEWADMGICGTAMLAAAATGLLRISSDQHYLSDVLGGAVVGLAVGFLVPWLLHYSGGRRPDLRGPPDLPPLAVMPYANENAFGAMVAGFL